ncbi:MAG: hypothetical protein NTZ24_14655 [Deltaproteobacteria bacterium]|nr:hypothetical protein [Deltaproteobacteria bacterium]
MSDLNEIESILCATLERAESSGYIGYSKYDGLHSPLLQALSFGFWPLRLIWTQIIMRSPINLRPVFFVKKGINPESQALFARANLDLYSLNGNEIHEERARGCLGWLVENDSRGRGNYHGSCWGYHHPWQNPGFYQPPGYPNCYLTVVAGGALLHGFRILNGEDYLKTARSAVDFILRDLDVLYETGEEKCISYVPKMKTDFAVININALAASFIGQVGVLTGENFLLSQARKLLSYVSRRQTSYGAWFYTTNPGQSLLGHDNYHTGMILDAFHDYERATGDGRFRSHYDRGLKFYWENLFLTDGAPKWASDKTLPHDVHGSAQGILTFSKAGEWEKACRIASWGIGHFYKGSGEFSYQKGRFINKRFTLSHWCNGWMARGLAALLPLIKKKQLAGEK